MSQGDGAARSRAKTLMARFFLGRYEREGLVNRKQAESLLYTLLAMSAATLIIAGVMTDRVAGLAIFGVAILSAALTLLVKAGLASVASGAATLLLSVSFAALSFLEPFDAAYEIYLITALQGFVLMITGIIARGKWQSLGVMAIALAALALDFFSRIVPAGLFSKNVDDYVICNLVIVISAFIGRAIMSRNTLLLRKAESEASESAERLSRLEAAVESSRGSLDLGITVRESAERTRILIDELRTSSLAAKDRMEALAASIRSIVETQAEISGSSEAVEASIADQTAVVTQSSAAIEEMTASIGSISAITGSRRESIRRLKETTGTGANEMARAAEAVKEMEQSSSSIVDVVAVIRSVASRTNLLAMNAAIEAAHAGESGRGFSVVADEIRKLSEATGQNVKLIATGIKGTIDSMRTASEVNARAQEIFRQIDAEADSVAAAMEEIARGIGEVSEGSGEILKGVSESVNITARVRDAASGMNARIRLSDDDVGQLDAATSEVRAALGSMVARFDDILAEAHGVSEAGAANEAGLRELSSALSRLK